MSTLQIIGFSVVGGTITSCIGMVLFGIAVSRRHIFIAPRATARPPDVIYNPQAKKPTTTTTTTDDNGGSDRHEQYRGHPMFGWIGWTLGLDYDTMLRGIPGTGTRQNGLGGKLLNVTVDGIVLLRFHALGMRIAAFISILYLCVLVPVYYTAQCYRYYDDGNDDDIDTYDCVIHEVNQTNPSQTYQKLTFGNLPQLQYTSVKTTAFAATATNANDDWLVARLYIIVILFYITMFYVFRELHKEWITILAIRRVYYLEYDVYGERQAELQRTRIFSNASSSVGAVATPLSSNNHHHDTVAKGNREQKQFTFQQQQLLERRRSTDSSDLEQMKQQKNPKNNQQRQLTFQQHQPAELEESNARTSKVKISLPKKQKKKIISREEIEEPHLFNREPWIPHPEEAETVPNVSLYSVLVGGLPNLPLRQDDPSTTHQDDDLDDDCFDDNDNNNCRNDDRGSSTNRSNPVHFSKREIVDWQLSLTIAFFDHCVPNQPGFSSSIAAVTIIPGANALATAWKKWSKAASKLRRLRFIRELIRRQKQEQLNNHNKRNPDDTNEVYVQENAADYYIFEDDDENNNVAMGVKGKDNYKKRKKDDDAFISDIETGCNGDHVITTESSSSSKNRYRQSSSSSSQRRTPCKIQAYYRSVLGSFRSFDEDSDDEEEEAEEQERNLVHESLSFGPEQAAVYSREFAQVASGCKPNGFCCEGKIRHMPLDELIKLEQQAEEETMEAYEELKQARDKAAIFSDYVANSNNNSRHNCHNSDQQLQHGEEDDKEPNVELVLNSGHEITPILEDDDENARGHRPPKSNYISQYPSLDESYDDLPPDPPTSEPSLLPILSEQTLKTTGGSGRHRKKKPSLDNIRMPSDLALEEHLYRKTTWDGHSIQLENKNSSNIMPSAGYVMQKARSTYAVVPSQSVPVNTVPRPPSVSRSITHPEHVNMATITEGRRRHTDPSISMSSSQGQSGPENMTSSTLTYTMEKDRIGDGEKVLHPDNSGGGLDDNEASTGRPVCVESSKVTRQERFQKASADISLRITVRDDEDDVHRSRTSNDSRRRSTSYVSGSASRSRFLSVDESMRRVSSVHVPSRSSMARSRSMSVGELMVSAITNIPPSPVAKVVSGTPSTKKDHTTQWIRVENIVVEAMATERDSSQTSSSAISTGVWSCPALMSTVQSTGRHVRQWAMVQKDKAVTNLARDSTYAVVTFTSRQAAIAARGCLADGRGHRRWLTMSEIPIPPLADAPANLGSWDCRHCCLPVTVSLNEQRKTFRNYFSMVLLALIYVFYTVPLTFASRLVDPDSLNELFPQTSELSVGITQLMSGLLTAGIWSLFFTLCPMMFLSIANYGSKATSVAQSEFSALQYYWWFMILTAFSGQTIANMALKGFNEGLQSGDLTNVLRSIALTIPTVMSISWLNWIIFRCLIILPLNYLLQINTYIYHALGWDSCSRLMRGGGPGGPVPYRIYIDSGTVFLCLLALGPASPMIAPACFVYFLLCQPLLRRNLIFVYRPKFDGGGHRWPFIFSMCISALVVAEILLAIQMGLKQATGPACIAGLAILPTFMFSHEMKKQYLRSFEDAALCQTSMLDGWYDDEGKYSLEKREDFRRFLVDAHKAAYVPVCLASPDTDDFLTAEPAVVIPRPGEALPPQLQMNTDTANESPMSENNQAASYRLHSNGTTESVIRERRRQSQQHGATMRRAGNGYASMIRVAGSDVEFSSSSNDDAVLTRVSFPPPVPTPFLDGSTGMRNVKAD